MVLRSYTSRILMAATLAGLNTAGGAAAGAAGGASGRGARCTRCGTRRRPGCAAGQVS